MPFCQMLQVKYYAIQIVGRLIDAICQTITLKNFRYKISKCIIGSNMSIYFLHYINEFFDKLYVSFSVVNLQLYFNGKGLELLELGTDEMLSTSNQKILTYTVDDPREKESEENQHTPITFKNFASHTNQQKSNREDDQINQKKANQMLLKQMNGKIFHRINYFIEKSYSQLKEQIITFHNRNKSISIDITPLLRKRINQDIELQVALILYCIS
ncbi:unnamed protein product [Paramecium sonneborni]|uniref:Uncharacterized protein n=1 Tax=Paramecium sonneborni TaxID=65129 RepID=A0A8S1R5X9_9CILI|nr:unnamed protein product [Paramecium sonneborni]